MNGMVERSLFGEGESESMCLSRKILPMAMPTGVEYKPLLLHRLHHHLSLHTRKLTTLTAVTPFCHCMHTSADTTVSG